jgi:nucleoside-diphosphate-sugar epimerase
MLANVLHEQYASNVQLQKRRMERKKRREDRYVMHCASYQCVRARVRAVYCVYALVNNLVCSCRILAAVSAEKNRKLV